MDVVRTARMEGHGWHRVHVWLCNVLDHDRDVEVPCTDGLVVGGRYEPSVFIHERDCIHGTQMLIILLCDLARVDVVLNCMVQSAEEGQVHACHNALE